MSWTIRPIGTARSVWKDRFGIPRQAGLVPEALARIELHPGVVRPEALRGLESFSHLWVIFGFHRATTERQAVRAPRHAERRGREEPRARAALPTRVGVLATRSPHRPNHLGLSAVRLVGVDPAGAWLEVGGADLLDGTPVFDLKPYLPYADRISEASSGWAEGPLPRQEVRFAPEVARRLADQPRFEAVLRETFALDPRRPGARHGSYASRIGDYDVRARVDPDGSWTVEALEPLPGSPARSAGDPPQEEAEREPEQAELPRQEPHQQRRAKRG